MNKDIQQSVELRPEEERFMRLLEILGTWYTQGKVLVFVQTQDQCDNLFRDLLKVAHHACGPMQCCHQWYSYLSADECTAWSRQCTLLPA